MKNSVYFFANWFWWLLPLTFFCFVFKFVAWCLL